jgi:hypothetical protein
LLTETENCCDEPQDGDAETWTTNVPRLPAPFFAVTVITADPWPPSIRVGDTEIVILFPFPTCDALMV